MYSLERRWATSSTVYGGNSAHCVAHIISVLSLVQFRLFVTLVQYHSVSFTRLSQSHLFDCAGTPPHSSHLHSPLGSRAGLCSQTLLPNFPKRGQYVHTTT